MPKMQRLHESERQLVRELSSVPAAELLHHRPYGGACSHTLRGGAAGRLFVCVSASSEPREFWSVFSDAVVEMGHRCLSYDSYGRGATPMPPDGRVTRDAEAHLLAQLLDDLVGRDAPCILVAHSSGGLVAARFADLLLGPELVSELVSSSLGEMVESLASAVLAETDLSVEAAHMAAFEGWRASSASLRRAGLAAAVVVPAVHARLSTASVLTMERLSGPLIDECAAADAAQTTHAGWKRALRRATTALERRDTGVESKRRPKPEGSAKGFYDRVLQRRATRAEEAAAAADNAAATAAITAAAAKQPGLHETIAAALEHAEDLSPEEADSAGELKTRIQRRVTAIEESAED